MKAVLIGALAATAYSADTVVFPTTLKVASTEGTGCCFPSDAGVTVATSATDATKKSVTFTFQAATTTCTTGLGAGTQVTGEAVPSASNTVTVTPTIGGATKNVILTVPTNGVDDYLLDLTDIATGCKAYLQKAPATVPPAYSGVYEVKTKQGTAAQCCYPTGDIIIRQNGAAGTAVTVDWTYAAAGTDCPATGAGGTLAGTSHTASGTPNTVTGSVALTESTNKFGLTYAPNIAVDSGILLQLQGGVNNDDCAVSIAKKTLPTVAYAGVYETTDNGKDADCCFPATDVTVTADGTAYNLAWTFGEEAGCPAALKGQKISAKATPDVATKDVEITQTLSGTDYTFNLEYPATATGDWTLDLSAIKAGCSSTLEKKSGYLVGLGSLVALSLSYIMF